MSKPQFAEVEWEDAWSDDKRVPAEEGYYEQAVIMHESGWLKTNDDERVVICRQYSDHIHNGDARMFSDCIAIPRGMVRNLTIIKNKS
jgi:hypothetical protein